GILGAGSIGAYLGGRLTAAGVTTVLVARQPLVDAVGRDGLHLTSLDGFDQTLPPSAVHIVTNPLVLASCDFILVTVKGHDTVHVARQLPTIIRHDAIVVSFQNGVGNVEILHRALGEHAVLAGMVPFNVLRRGESHFHQGVSGVLAVQALPDGRHAPLVEALRKAGLPTEAYEDMRGIQWGKLLVNLNNSINALSGLPLQQQLAQRPYRKVMAACVREGLRVLKRAGIKPEIEAPMPPSLLPAVMELPNAIFKIAAKRIVAIDPNARSSMWEDLQRGRKTEVDLLNGEIVRLGAQLDVPTPINQRIVDLVKEAEHRGAPPSLPAEELQRRVLHA
ncbi:MAG TPA: 2-dehydropantoate 2-reductase, partial [Ideonella sp.]|nr:2-dehydropantoate 2-reductase [Ideonella sp.]